MIINYKFILPLLKLLYNTLEIFYDIKRGYQNDNLFFGAGDGTRTHEPIDYESIALPTVPLQQTFGFYKIQHKNYTTKRQFGQ